MAARVLMTDTGQGHRSMIAAGLLLGQFVLPVHSPDPPRASIQTTGPEESCTSEFVEGARDYRAFWLSDGRKLQITADTPDSTYRLRDGRTIELRSRHRYPRAFSVCEPLPWRLSVRVTAPSAAVLVPEAAAVPVAEAREARVKTALAAFMEAIRRKASGWPGNVYYLSAANTSKNFLEIPSSPNRWRLVCVALDDSICDALHERGICLFDEQQGEPNRWKRISSRHWPQHEDLLMMLRLTASTRRIEDIASND